MRGLHVEACITLILCHSLLLPRSGAQLPARLLLLWIDCANPLPVRADLEPHPPRPLSVPTRSNMELTS